MKQLFKSKKKTKSDITGEPLTTEPVTDDPSSSPSGSEASPPAGQNKGYLVTLEISSLVLGLTKDISEFSSALGPLKAACSAVSRVIDVLKKVEKNRTGWRELVERIETHLRRWQKEVDKMESEQSESGFKGYPRDKDMEDAMIIYLKKLQEILEVANTTISNRKGTKGFFKSASLASIDEETITGFTRQLDSNFQDFTTALTSYVADQVRRVAHETKQMVLLMKLKEAPLSARQSEKQCAPGTRTELLERVRLWGLDKDGIQRVLLISDVAGCGKSTVANHMADEWAETSRLVGRFYFSSEEADTSTSRCISSQLARDIFTRYPSLLDKFSSTLDGVVSITSLRFPRQFHILVTEPLLGALEVTGSKDQLPMIMVFDALDECVDRREFITVLLAELKSLPFVKVLLTSRPDPSIDAILENSNLVVGGRDVALYLPSEPPERRDEDVTAYIQQRLKGNAFFTPYRVRRLVERSAGLFLFASIACDELLKTWVQEETFTEIISIKAGYNNLDSLYINILERTLPNDKSTKVLMPVLQTLLAARIPISISTIERFLPTQSQTERVVKHLGSLMKDGTPHRPIHLVHATFREFLFEEKRSGIFYIRPALAHRDLAVQCLRVLIQHLHPDLCSLADHGAPYPMPRKKPASFSPPPHTQNQEFVPVKYAIQFWADHARDAVDEPETQHYLRQFFEHSLLYWIEWISVFQIIPDAVSSVQNLQYVLGTNLSESKTLYEYCRELKLFLQKNQVLIEAAPLQVYMSAITFTAPDSVFQRHLVKSCRRKIPRVLRQPPEVEISNCKVLSGHRHPVERCAFSPSGTKLVSAALNDRIRLWDPAVGSSITPLDQNPSDYLVNLTFSPDEKYILGWDTDFAMGGVRLWDAETGDFIGKMMAQYHTITCGNISPDSLTVATGHARGVRLWRIDDNFDPNLSRLIDHDMGETLFTSFSSNSKQILIGSATGGLQLWDCEGRRLVSELSKQGPKVTQAIFVHDEKKVVGISVLSKTIRNWDISTETPTERTLDFHTTDVVTLVASSHSQFYASGSKDGIFVLWDAISDTPLLPILDHSMGGTATKFTDLNICFSTDCTKIATGASTGPIRVWDIQDPNHPCINVFQGPEPGVNYLCFSPDDRQLAACGPNKELRLWDVTTPSLSIVDTPSDHQGPVVGVRFSPDGNVIATWSRPSHDKTNITNHYIRLWDSHSGNAIGLPLIGHTAEVTSVSFSSSATFVVSGSKDKTVRVWSISRIKPDMPLEPELVYTEHLFEILQVKVLKNDAHILSRDSQGSRVWDSSNGHPAPLSDSNEETTQVTREHPLYYDPKTHRISSRDIDTPLLELPHSFQLAGPVIIRNAWRSFDRCIALGSDRGNIMVIRWEDDFI